MLHIESLLQMNQAELQRTLDTGHAIDPSWLDDTEYHGVSLGLPAIIDRLAWKTFQKSFHRDTATNKLRGFNVRLAQTGVNGPVQPLEKRGRPKTFGHFEVTSAEDDAPAGEMLPGILLDYGKGQNSTMDLIRFIRDPLVAIKRGDPSLLFGRTYIEVGQKRFGTPCYFALKRHGPLTYLPNA
jgi:hypothetical protein